MAMMRDSACAYQPPATAQQLNTAKQLLLRLIETDGGALAVFGSPVGAALMAQARFPQVRAASMRRCAAALGER